MTSFSASYPMVRSDNSNFLNVFYVSCCDFNVLYVSLFFSVLKVP